jgi:concanavalin A-like lectin/glucanase superfamily protein/type IX secretion system substrate protein/peptide-N-glycosidase F-like protein
MNKTIFLLSFGMILSFFSTAQDTTVIQTLTYDSTGRNYVFQFPPDDGTSYEKIIMEYNMRCKGALVSTGANTNLGCGEWDYSCNTYIIDSTYTDSLRTIHPSHIISGFSGDVFDYTSNPTHTYYQYDQQQVIYNNTISETTATIGSGTDMLNHPFGTSGAVSKSQYLWTAGELTTAGLNAGDISSIRLNLNTANTATQFLKIKMKHTNQITLDAATIELEDFSEVYFLNTSFIAGENEFLFYNNFNWDGTSNILVEFSFTNSGFDSGNMVEGSSMPANFGLVSSGQNYNLEITGSEYLDLPTVGLEYISNEISIAFWSFGNPDVLPTNTYFLEGVDDQNRRQASLHLPWGNSQVYWDCGNNGTYDRINKAANPEDFSGKWNHWTFTKNAVSGEMKIYLNGSLWHSGTGKTRPIDLTKFTLGGSNNHAGVYYGNMDEFQIWSVELSDAEITEWMSKSIDATHPQYNNLVAYYKMDEGTGFSTQNNATSGGVAQINGQANWKNLKGENIYTNFNTTTQRPNITFVQGEYESVITAIPVIDTVINNQHAVTTYQVTGTDLEIQSVEYFWEAGFEYLYNSSGMILDSFPTFSQGIINIEDLVYYRKFPSEFEIMSFVTPYGINLDLGENGKTWIFDVTDFAPILKGNKRMLMKLGGQNQEEMDIKFLFIEGTPPRDVKNIQQIWKSGSGYSYTAIMNDNILEPRDILLDDQGEYFKIRTMVTGHGQEGEFIPRNHWVNINGGDPEFVWSVWKACGDNPIFPQGGTWIYDRAGWCPGAPTDLQEWDITDMVTPGETVNVDYNVTAGSGDSRYITSHQLVTYGEANFSLDASIVEIKEPSKRTEYDRTNPICNDPIVVLRNTGSTTLTSATITYQVDGGNAETFEWTGNLKFMESEEVILPVQEVSFWAGSDVNIFTATVSNPNGGQDEYAQNSSQSTSFELPDIYNQEVLIIGINTNNAAAQNSYTVKDITGNIILSKSNLTNNTFYRDTLYLDDGCYSIELNDTGNNGLDFWAQSNQGTGSFTIRTLGQVLKIFEPDFGSSIKYSFIKGQITNVESPDFKYTFNVFPNPTTGIFQVLLDLPDYQNAQLMLFDITGRVIQSQSLDHFSSGTINLDLSNQPNGMYHCTIVTDNWTETRKVLKMKER